MRKLVVLIFTSLFVIACTPEVGSDEWCKSLKEKSSNDWTIQETKDYAKHCMFK